MKQNVNAINQMTDEIDALFESSPEIEAKFSSVMTKITSEFDRLQIDLLENSVLDSTEVSVEKSVVTDNDIMLFDELKTDSYETDEVLQGEGDKLGTRSSAFGISDTTFCSFIEGGSSVCDGAVSKDQVQNIEARNDVCVPHGNRNLAAEELISRVDVVESKACYDFSVLEKEKDRAEQFNMKKASITCHGSDGVTEDRKIGKLLIGVNDRQLLDCHDHQSATYIEDKQYIEEFSQKIESLDALIEKEYQKKPSSERIQRNLKIICAPRNELVTDPEELSSSLCSMESSGIYSFDHDENHHCGGESMSHIARHTSSSMPQGMDVSLSMEVQLSMDEDLTIGNDSALLLMGPHRSSRPADAFIQPHPISEERSQKELNCIIDADEKVGNTEKKKLAEGNNSAEGTYGFEISVGDKNGKVDFVDNTGHEVICHVESKNMERNLCFNGAEFDNIEVLLEGEQEAIRENMEIGRSPPQEVVCHRSQDDDVILPEIVNICITNDVQDKKRGTNAMQGSYAKLYRSSTLIQENIQPYDVLSQEYDRLDLVELVRKLEFASNANPSQQNDSFLVSNNPSIQVIPPTPRRASVGSNALDDFVSSSVENLSFDLPDINIIPATPRRLSISSKDGSSPQPVNDIKPVSAFKSENVSACIVKPSYNRSVSESIPAPDINVIPPTPRRQSLDLTCASNSFPMIQIIPPTPRRQSLASESDISFPIAHASGGSVSGNLKDEPSPPSLFSSFPSPLIPRVWNWLEKSVFEDSMTSVDDILEDGISIDKVWESIQPNTDHEKDEIHGTEVVHDGCYEPGSGFNESHQRDQSVQKVEIEAQIYELKISDVASRWPETDDFENNGLYSAVKSEHGDEQFVCGDQLDEVDSRVLEKNRKGQSVDFDIVATENEAVENEAVENEVKIGASISKPVTKSEDVDGTDEEYPVDVAEDIAFTTVAEPIGKDTGTVQEESDKVVSVEEEDRGENKLLERRGIGREYETLVLFDDLKNEKVEDIMEEGIDRVCSIEPLGMGLEPKPSISDDWTVFSGDSTIIPDESKIVRGDTTIAADDTSIVSDKLKDKTACTEKNNDGRFEKEISFYGSQSEMPPLIQEHFTDLEAIAKGDFPELSTFGDIEDQLRNIGAHKLALKQRRDSGAVEETTCGITCLDDLIDNETHDAMAAGMDAFYMRISGCLESMKNIDVLLIDGSESYDGQLDPTCQLRVIIT